MQGLLSLILLVCLAFFARYFVGMGIGAPWLPLRRRDLPDGFALAEIRAGDTVVDLGSGDGRLLVEAAKCQAEVIGYELNPLLVWWSRYRLRSYGTHTKIYRKNLLDADLSKADVIFIFGITSIMPKVAKKMQAECRPGTRIISFAFALPGFKLDQTRGIAMRYLG